jgi:hypothetical protein
MTLAELGGLGKFDIDTKTLGFIPGSLKRESVLNGMQQSLANLGVESVRLL